MRRALPYAFILLTFAPVTVQAVTAKEILELSRAGLSEEVLLALIEVDGGVFTLDTNMLKSLKEANVSERVILAMVRSGRTPQTESVPAPVMTEQAVDPAPYVAPQPQVIVIEHERPVVEQVARTGLCRSSPGPFHLAWQAFAGARATAVRSLARLRCAAAPDPPNRSRQARAGLLGMGRQVAS